MMTAASAVGVGSPSGRRKSSRSQRGYSPRNTASGTVYTQVGLFSAREDASLDDDFTLYDREHPDIYQAFKAMASALVAQGFTRYSIYSIAYAVRLQHDITRGPGDEFAINNNYLSRYARKLAAEDPARFGSFFQFRALKSERTAKATLD